MTDTTPAPEVPKATLWSRYRGLPIWAQILILLAILAVIVLVHLSRGAGRRRRLAGDVDDRYRHHRAVQ